MLAHVDEEDRRRIEAVTAQAIRERSDYAYERRIRAADGRHVWLRVSASLVLDEHGEPALIRGVWLDVTALKEAEAEREGSYSLLQATLDATADAILVVNLEGQITHLQPPVRGAVADPAVTCSIPATTRRHSAASVAESPTPMSSSAG